MTTAPTLPIHEITYRKARDLILFGELAPGEAVTIQGVVERLGTGITPAREAIRRLTAEGALRASDNRRLMVPKLTLEHLQELTYARTGIEPQIARLAAVAMDPADIDALEQIDAQVNAALRADDIPAYLRHNHVFHWTLYAHSEAEILMATAAAHWLRVGPSLRDVVKRNKATPLPDMHEVAIAALRDGDYEAVGEAIHNDILQGHANIAEGLDEAD
ncbi:GntR family transcriptional regulator [Sulfitobacter sp. F26169L]|uniref:GntR family transcriptional regulator n=1 Tax=Sulfitobacter sp. F26169L TaxID=2996015 RepID=UPI002260FE57|nr:GntR family transcriptional regulator [Sulfitobacter sp. F26169L]MCX7568142.1 GntR family transcriptional regulator [Sulfitobacter sp. F26169L]